MPEHIRPDEQDLYNAETHHEQTDVPIRPLWWVIAIFVAFAVATHIILWFYFKALVKSERERSSTPRTSVARPANLNVPQNQPLLQPFPQKDARNTAVPPYRTTPVVDLIEMRKAEHEALSTYGWVDRQKGVVRLPIELAKKMFVARAAASATAGAQPAAPIPPTTTSALGDGMSPAPAPAVTTQTAVPATTGGHAQ